MTAEIDYDAKISAALDAILPLSGDHGDWRGVVADASSSRWPKGRPRFRRTALAFAVGALAVIVPLAALADSNGWWFFSDSGSASAPSPVGDVVTVASGRWQGTPWALTAYRTTSDGLCVAFTPNPPSGLIPGASSSTPPASALMMGCGAPVQGVPNLPHLASHQIGFTDSSSAPGEGRRFDVIAGPVAADVAEVEILQSDGASVRVASIPAPTQLDAPVRFFVSELPLGTTLKAVVALDNSGNTIETVSVPAAPSSNHGGVTDSNTYTYSFGS